MDNKVELQRLFDTSLAHIRKQGTFALSDKSIKINEEIKEDYPGEEENILEAVCAYKNSEGLMCAAAPFINDKALYSFEGSWGSLVHHLEDQYPGKPVDYVDKDAYLFTNFVEELQKAHDQSVTLSILKPDMFMGHYEEYMRALAGTTGLVYTDPK